MSITSPDLRPVAKPPCFKRIELRVPDGPGPLRALTVHANGRVSLRGLDRSADTCGTVTQTELRALQSLLGSLRTPAPPPPCGDELEASWEVVVESDSSTHCLSGALSEPLPSDVEGLILILQLVGVRVGAAAQRAARTAPRAMRTAS